MIGVLFLAGIICICLVVEAFFSGSEIAFISANKPKLFRNAKGNHPASLLCKQLLSQPERLFSTTVVGTTFAINSATTFFTLYIIHRFGPSKEWINLIILTPLILIFGEFIPKMACRMNADRAVLKLCYPIYWASLVLYPFTKILSIYAQTLKYIIGENPEKSFFLSREEIKAALPASRGSDVTATERELIERILESRRVTAKEMLRPLIDVVAVEENESIRDAIRLFSESGHSRIPVYRDRIDHIIGIVHGYHCLFASDLLAPVKTVMQPAFFVPESKPLDELLSELRTRTMAVAVNEYGGAAGILTLEDVMEEIVGEIEDEYDEPPRLYRQIGENSYIVNARMEVDAMREQLKIVVPKDDEYQTLAGFLLNKMQKIPKKWDSIIVDGVEYVIQSATDRSIEEVYIRLLS